MKKIFLSAMCFILIFSTVYANTNTIAGTTSAGGSTNTGTVNMTPDELMDVNLPTGSNKIYIRLNQITDPYITGREIHIYDGGIIVEEKQVKNTDVSTSISTVNLTPGKNYYVKLKTFFTNGQGKYGQNIKNVFLPNNIVYNAPQLSKTMTSDGLNLTWNQINNPNLLGYKIVVSKNNSAPEYPADGYIRWITNASTTNYVLKVADTGSSVDFNQIQENVYYHAAITAVYNDGTNKIYKTSNVVKVFFQPTGPPITTFQLGATVIQDNIDLSWGATNYTGFTGYDVMAGSSLSNMQRVSSTTTTTYNVNINNLPNFTYGKDYYLKIGSNFTNGTIYSNTETINVTQSLPSTFQLSAQTINDDVYLNWQPITNAALSGYDVYGGNSQTNMTKIKTTTSTSYKESVVNVPSFTYGQDYYIKVIAKFTDGNAVESNKETINVTQTINYIPVSLYENKINDSEYELEWDKLSSSNVEKYIIKAQDSAGAVKTLDYIYNSASLANTVTFAINKSLLTQKGLTLDTTYNYFVTTRYFDSTELDSSPVTFEIKNAVVAYSSVNLYVINENDGSLLFKWASLGNTNIEKYILKLVLADGTEKEVKYIYPNMINAKNQFEYLITVNNMQTHGIQFNTNYSFKVDVKYKDGTIMESGVKAGELKKAAVNQIDFDYVKMTDGIKVKVNITGTNTDTYKILIMDSTGKVEYLKDMSFNSTKEFEIVPGMENYIYAYNSKILYNYKYYISVAKDGEKKPAAGLEWKEFNLDGENSINLDDAKEVDVEVSIKNLGENLMFNFTNITIAGARNFKIYFTDNYEDMKNLKGLYSIEAQAGEINMSIESKLAYEKKYYFRLYFEDANGTSYVSDLKEHYIEDNYMKNLGELKVTSDDFRVYVKWKPLNILENRGYALKINGKVYGRVSRGNTSMEILKSETLIEENIQAPIRFTLDVITMYGNTKYGLTDAFVGGVDSKFGEFLEKLSIIEEEFENVSMNSDVTIEQIDEAIRKYKNYRKHLKDYVISGSVSYDDNYTKIREKLRFLNIIERNLINIRIKMREEQILENKIKYLISKELQKEDVIIDYKNGKKQVAIKKDAVLENISKIKELRKQKEDMYSDEKEKAKVYKNTYLTINVEEEDNAEIVLDKESIESLKNEKVKLEIKNKHAIVKINPETVSKNKEVKIKTEKINEQRQNELKNIIAREREDIEVKSNIYDFNVKAGEEEITKFEDKLNITIKLSEEEMTNINDKRKAAVYYVKEDGELEFVGGKFIGEDIEFETDHLSMYMVMEYDKTFDDIDDHWAKDEIEVLASRKIINGTDAENFTPDGNVTREQFAALIGRGLNIKPTEDENELDFNDVRKGSYSEGYIKALSNRGLLAGYSDGTFKPKKVITKEEMATILLRAYSYYTGEETDNIEIATVSFEDLEKSGNWSRDNIKKATSLGLLKSYDNEKFSPKVDAKREDAAKTIYNLLENINQF